MTARNIQPKVSIVIPVFNGAHYLREAIDSALGQTYRNTEVIVVDDGSTDGGMTDAIAHSYGSRILYVRQHNGGVGSALNRGISMMSGAYFSWLSHDDVYLPEKIERQITFLKEECNEDTILYGGYHLIDSKSRLIDTVDFSRLYSRERLNVPLMPVMRGMANGCTMLIHRSHFGRVGGFDTTLKTTQDYELWYRMFRGADVRFCPGIYVKTRFHSRQTSRVLPEHLAECDRLWIAMMDGLTAEEMYAMEGSAYEFFERTADHLRRHSTYSRAEKHARQLATGEAQKAWNGQPARAKNPGKRLYQGRPRRAIRRLIHTLRSDGIACTATRLFRRLW